MCKTKSKYINLYIKFIKSTMSILFQIFWVTLTILYIHSYNFYVRYLVISYMVNNLKLKIYDILVDCSASLLNKIEKKCSYSI